MNLFNKDYISQIIHQEFNSVNVTDINVIFLDQNFSAPNYQYSPNTGHFHNIKKTRCQISFKCSEKVYYALKDLCYKHIRDSRTFAVNTIIKFGSNLDNFNLNTKTETIYECDMQLCVVNNDMSSFIEEFRKAAESLLFEQYEKKFNKEVDSFLGEACP